ncbi:hypothetical protein GTA08_BOTSDO07226 [Botryosphaeria dothidea]|uniref:P-loop containing nucleoside triphosphate hydrolase protein n=1 Tax=Botryosphaeria dothidea TaxID=55169 RepID=A0A8H4IPP0_9PEZI|nr:hypothetical protein GTA08_BOTSDO11422 [Botryosphaeria dothidea]KAF4305136.1 hypothetical protein GTA08_BOTSDO07226 [Botryosphaeria dothidea]
MSTKPIFAATHPRACSTAFERVFMTCRDTLQCVHEPFGDAFYFGPERLSERYEQDEAARAESGFEDSTYRTIFERIDRENTEGKRLFIKDITHYLVPPDHKPASIASSLVEYKRGVGTDLAKSNPHARVDSAHGTDAVTNGDVNGAPNGVSHEARIEVREATKPPYPYPTTVEAGNPTVVPTELLSKFHWTFLIRHPRNSIPSYYRCTIPPLDDITGFKNFMPSEAGYDELRRTFDYLKNIGLVGPRITGQDNTEATSVNGTVKPPYGAEPVDICVIDADDLLDDPAGIISKYCESVGMEYSPDMLNWDNEEDHRIAKEKFEKWKGFHEDAIDSKDLKPRAQKKIPKPDDELYAEWVQKFGEEGAKTIKETVDANVADYEYLKQFAMRV